MKNLFFLFTILLFICHVKTFAKGETIYSKLDSTTYMIAKVEESDSLIASDSLEMLKKYKTAKIVKTQF